MAFSKTPSESTYQTKKVKLISSLYTRDKAGTKDIIPINCFYDIVENKTSDDKDYDVVKRDGTVTYPYTIPSAVIRGMHYWKDQDKLYVAYDDKIAIITASTGVLATTVTPFVTTTGDVGFTEFNYTSNAVKVVASDGSRIITIDSANTVVTGVDADQPSSINPHIIFLDGYLFVLKAGTADVYNSNLDDPLAFTAGDFITAELNPDLGSRLAKLNNYIVAFGTSSIEYFWDAAVATGSPLSRNDTPVKYHGYLGGFVEYGNKGYFIGKTKVGGPALYVMEDFKLKPITIPSIKRYMQPYSSFTGAIVTFGGRDFYVMTVGSITYCMDLETELWTRLAFKATSTMPITFAVNIPISGGEWSSVFAQSGTATLHYFDADIYQDAGTNFTVSHTTDTEDFDTIREKYMSRIMVHADRPTATASLGISWTDDDYQTFSTERTVNLNQEFPTLHRAGRFRQRAFKMTFAANYPLRLKTLEVDYNLGQR